MPEVSAVSVEAVVSGPDGEAVVQAPENRRTQISMLRGAPAIRRIEAVLSFQRFIGRSAGLYPACADGFGFISSMAESLPLILTWKPIRNP